jgi:hypothetical protein
MRNKRAAMEMTVGTIVTIVLLMSALVLGLILTNTVFKSAKGAIDLTDQELTSRISKAFGSEDAKLAVYPQSAELDIKQEDQEEIGLGIRNLLEGVSGTIMFSYDIAVDENTCDGEKKDFGLEWINIGKTGANIPINVGDSSSERIRFNIPSGSPLCSVEYRVIVKYINDKDKKIYNYDTITFIVNSKAK